MTTRSVYFHPNLDHKKHPILDENRSVNFHPNMDHKKHPILDENRSIQLSSKN